LNHSCSSTPATMQAALMLAQIAPMRLMVVGVTV
jgi:hypothetical protein